MPSRSSSTRQKKAPDPPPATPPPPPPQKQYSSSSQDKTAKRSNKKKSLGGSHHSRNSSSHHSRNSSTKSDKKKKRSNTTSPSSAVAGMPVLFFVLQAFLWLGTGSVLAFLYFFVQWKGQCASLLTSSLQQQGTAERQQRRALQSSLDAAKRDHAACQEQYVVQTQELTRLRRELQQVHDATSASQQEVVDRIQSLQTEKADLQTQLATAQQQLETAQQAARQQVEELQNQLQRAQFLTRQKSEQLERHQRRQQQQQQVVTGSSGEDVPPAGWSETTNGSGTSRTVQEWEDQIVQLHGNILWRRETAACRSAMENAGAPFVVEFAVDLADLRSPTYPVSHFAVEFVPDAVTELPHTVWTFLSLVRAGLYEGTTLAAVFSDEAVTGGSLATIDTQDSPRGQERYAQLQRLYVDAGYGPQQDVLLFEEFSPRFPCTQFTFGLVGKGPGIIIPLTNHDDHDHDDNQNGNDSDGDSNSGMLGSSSSSSSSRACPGRIIRGRETLLRIQERGKAEQQQHRVTILGARILQPPPPQQQQQHHREEL